MSRLSKLIIKNIICKPCRIKVVIRCTGGSKGPNYSHIQKVMNAISSANNSNAGFTYIKNPKKTVASKDLTNPKYNTNITKQIGVIIDQYLGIKQGILYNIFLCQNATMWYKPPKQKTEVLCYLDTQKNILCGSLQENGIRNYKKFSSSSDDSYKSITNYLFDNEIPLTPIMRLYIIERLGIKINASRGCIYTHMVNQIYSYGDPDSQILCKTITVENLPGKANHNFITELRFTLVYSHKLFNFSSHKIKTQEVRMLHDTLSNSLEQENSIKYTGQKNCDLFVRVLVNNEPLSFYIDIKQKNADLKICVTNV